MTHASLFSGIGGPEIAAAMLGWKNVFHCEINPFGRAILDYWFPNSESYEDITKTDFTKYRGRVDVLTGGFPCQPFSYAGKRGGQTDERYLWPEMLRVIDEVRPTWVIGENVAGITTMVESCEVTDLGSEASLFEENNGVHRFRSEHTFTIERICRDLESKGYSVQPMLIPACAVGAPHRRDRVFILAHNASDTDNNTDVRKPGKHESESREERIQERNEVQGAACDTERMRLEYDMDRGAEGSMSPAERERGQNSISEQVQFSETESGRGASSDSHSYRGNEIHQYLQSKQPDGAELVSNGRIRNVADTIRERLERQDESRSSEGGERMYLWRDFTGCCGAYGEGLRPEERWANFPTVSPVHRGNDGIPFDVDYLSIPFSKWRNESLKAYGNAIVPQVMYRIFQCIEQLNKV